MIMNTYGNSQKNVKTTLKNKIGRAINKQQSIISYAVLEGYDEDFIKELKSQSLLLLEISEHYSHIARTVNSVWGEHARPNQESSK